MGSLCRPTGINANDAPLLANSLVTTDLGGTHSHGVLRFPGIREKGDRRRGQNPGAPSHIVTDSSSVIVVDGGNSMGQIGCVFAMERVIGRAKHSGLTAIRGSNHCGP